MLNADTAAPAEMPVAETISHEPAPSAAPSGDAPAPSLDEQLLDVWVKNRVPQDEKPAEAAKPGKVRGPDGKFASPDALTQDHQKIPADLPKEAAPAPQPAPLAVELPQSWSAEVKAKAAALPPEAREVLEHAALRDKQQHEAISKAGIALKQYEQQIASYRDYDQFVGQYKQEFAKRGVSPVQAFSTLLQAQSMLDANPADGLVRIAATYGIDLRPALFGPEAAQTQPDPVIAQLSAQLHEARAEIAQFKSEFSQQRQERERAQAEAEAAETQALQSQITTFSADKPFMQDAKVKKTMAGYLRDGTAKNLDEAYDMAVHAHPDTRAKIEADRRAKEEAARLADMKAKSEAALRAGAVNVKGGPSGKSAPRTMDDTLRETAARLFSS